MNAMKFFAVSLIAGAMSVSAFAGNHKEAEGKLQVSTVLEDLIELKLDKSQVELTYSESQGGVGYLSAQVPMLVMLRHASGEAERAFSLTVKQDGGGQTFKMKNKKGYPMPMNVMYYDETGKAPDEMLAPNDSKDYTTTNGLNGDKQTLLYFVVHPDDHRLAPAGTYKSNLTVMVAAK